MMKHYVFGYGSLVNQEALQQYLGRTCHAGEAVMCRLKGFRRCWNVAMDNSEDLPGYKYYLDAETHQRPPIFVTFLNIRPCAESAVGGVLFRVSEAELQRIDSRERNYERIEVSQLAEWALTAGKVWVYRGTPAAEARYRQGLHTGMAYIDEAYHHFVYNCFCCCGEEWTANYRAFTDAPEVPLRKLIRIDHEGQESSTSV